MFFYIYVSSASHPMSSQELVELLEECHVKNHAQGLSGILLYKDGNFMQLLEGDEADVRHTASRIANDPRHHSIISLLEGYEHKRQYPDWTMAFVDLDNEDIWSLPGYNPFLHIPLTPEAFVEEPTKAQKLILAFTSYVGRSSKDT